MSDMIKTVAALLDEAATAIAVGGSYEGAKVGLYVNNLIPDADTVVADLTEPTYPGYARSAAVVWGGLGVDAAGRVTSVGPMVEFNPTGNPTASEQAFGAFLVDSAGTTLLAVYPFDDPESITDQYSRILVAPYLIFGQVSGGVPVVLT